MSKWHHDSDEQRTRIYRAAVGGEFTDASALEYLRQTNPRLDYEVDQ